MKKLIILVNALCILLIYNNACSQTWNLSGNSGTNASSNFIGTTDNTNFKIRTNNNIRINITSSGKVAIGNFSPVFKLDVHGGSINTDSVYRILGVPVISRNSSNHIQLGDGLAKVGINTSTPSTTLEVNGDVTITGALAATGNLISAGGNSLNWNTAYSWGNHAAAGYLTAETDPQVGTNATNVIPKWNGSALVTGSIYDNGSVGIGTQSPLAKLQITHNSSNIDPQLFLYENANDFARLSFGNLGTTNYWSVAGINSNTNATARLNFYNSVFGNVMSLTGDGKVCIGTSTPATGYVLSIAGKAICTEMKVQLQSNWPDYVFDESYELSPLNDLKSFITANKHLPGIPSAQEINSDNGFELGTMQTNLVKKLEEITLYLIRQNDEMDKLKTENIKIQQQLNEVSGK